VPPAYASLVTSPVGLRERKKTATRQALHEAAVRLAVERGVDNVTIEAIADAASVSRRTFSNYFAGKEQALLYGDETRLRGLLDLTHARPATEPPWTALARAAEEFAAEHRDDPDWLVQVRLLRRHPALLAQQVATYAAAERELAGEIITRLPADATASLRARLLAATYLSTLRVATQLWLDQPDGPLIEVIRPALGIAQERFR
jgi:AcrR family transcriptional regulator